MIAIIKYNAGNTASVQNAVQRLGYACEITDDPKKIEKASKVILPGVGEASSAMEYLSNKKLDQLLISLRQPVLGICLGMQLMCESSEENNVQCMGIFKVHVKKFPATDIVPHMGWNSMKDIKGALMESVSPADSVYFIHSYYAEVNEDTIASCDYIKPFSAAMQKDNFYATQFHPEKSSITGEIILQNFLKL